MAGRPTRRAAALALFALAAGCAGAPHRPRDVAVVPTGDGNLLRYTAAEVTVLDQQGRAIGRFTNPTTKAPRGAALAMGSQLAVAVFDDRLAVTELSGTNEPTWVALASPFPTRSASLDADRCALVDGLGNARVVQLPASNQLWQGKAGLGLDDVVLVVATGAAEHVAVGRRSHDVVVQRMDFRRGDGLVAAETTIRDMNVLGAAGHAGGALFLAGLREVSAASTRGALVQYFVLVRVDLTTFRTEVLQDEKCAALETRVMDLAVGPEMLAVVLEQYKRGTSLRVFDQVQGRRPATWAFERKIAPGSSIAWISPDYVAVVGPDGETQVLHAVSDR